jgi:hypothetical protein
MLVNNMEGSPDYLKGAEDGMKKLVLYLEDYKKKHDGGK